MVGAGPNGLAAAIVIAQTSRKVVVLEAGPTVGGGARSAELTLPGFVHDICSPVHTFGILTAACRALPLAAHGLEWIEPPAMLAHPFDDGGCRLIYRSVNRRDGEGSDRNRGGLSSADWDTGGGLAEARRCRPGARGPGRSTRRRSSAWGYQALRSAESLARQVFVTRSDSRGCSPVSAPCRMLPLNGGVRAPRSGSCLACWPMSQAG